MDTYKTLLRVFVFVYIFIFHFDRRVRCVVVTGPEEQRAAGPCVAAEQTSICKR